jgi:hypothetical protein
MGSVGGFLTEEVRLPAGASLPLREGVLAYFLPHYDHIPLHRLWMFTTFQDELTLPEHAHIIDCDECRIGLRACLHAENFGAVLKELNLKDDMSGRKSA